MQACQQRLVQACRGLCWLVDPKPRSLVDKADGLRASTIARAARQASTQKNPNNEEMLQRKKECY